MTASMTPLLFALPGNEQMASLLVPLLRAEAGKATMRRFPDGETYWRYDTPVAGRDVALLCTLDRPDDKLPALLFAAAAARDLQARRVGLIAPYLAYMRQDHRFQPGEAISSATFARIVSGEVDWLITVDPHLHRRASLDEIYSVPTRALHAAPLIAQWISDNVDKPAADRAGPGKRAMGGSRGAWRRCGAHRAAQESAAATAMSRWRCPTLHSGAGARRYWSTTSSPAGRPWSRR